ncbi:DNA starvation/stationary phase protection protein [Runella sp. MFBS21]|uniref:Dps family protein n=1 Tax=Runella sp. MFBS21 TaxID=3034018 RepID=UPI0023F726FD|nr:DNA starvation/stationary phase protection protein [Runella sp. MFBS21]MDF7816202.1 DNA starvation/stationary phase protection protein [Runella sp. MFBS21]
MQADIGIPQVQTKKIVDVLHRLLADEHIILTKTRNYHWNIRGSSFMELHKFYESQYELLTNLIDEIAERVTQLGDTAIGTMKEFLETTRLEEGPYHHQQDQQIKRLLEDHQTLCKHLREDIDQSDKYDDPVTTDFLTGVLAQHEKMAWMLRSFLK